MPSSEAPAPPVIPSELSKTPDAPLSSLEVELDTSALSSLPKGHLQSIIDNWRASCYMASAQVSTPLAVATYRARLQHANPASLPLAEPQIFLQSNALLTEKLTKEHIKPRLLGHGGTTAGLAFAYSHTQGLVRRKGEVEGKEPKALFVTGPGHGGEF